MQKSEKIKHDYPGIKNPKMREFFEKGGKFIQNAGTAYTIRQGTPEWDVWMQYFDRHIGARPYGVQVAMAKAAMMKEDHKAEITVPTQFPEWFDRNRCRATPQKTCSTVAMASQLRRWPVLMEKAR
jgi:hypothetical protein